MFSVQAVAPAGNTPSRPHQAHPLNRRADRPPTADSHQPAEPCHPNQRRLTGVLTPPASAPARRQTPSAVNAFISAAAYTTAGIAVGLTAHALHWLDQLIARHHRRGR